MNQTTNPEDVWTAVQLNEGLKTECTLQVTVIPGISISLEFMSFYGFHDSSYKTLTEEQLGENAQTTAELREFLKTAINTIATDVVTDFQNARMRISVTADFFTVAGDQVLDVPKRVPEFPIYRHTARREASINESLMKLIEPSALVTDVDGVGSGLLRVSRLKDVWVTFITPINYNANALSTSMRLKPDNKLNKFVKYLPYNNDKFCMLHCILKTQLNAYDKRRVIVTDDEEYAEKFQEWFDENNLENFYQDDLFLMDKLTQLEERLKVSLNVFTYNNKKLDIFYRSGYKHNLEPIDIAILPMSQFVNIRNKSVSPYREPVVMNVDTERVTFLTKLGVKQYSNTIHGHAIVFNRNFFSKYHKSSDQIVCKYCNITTSKSDHEELCLQYHQGVDVQDRIKEYKETKKAVLDFNKYHAVYRVPFCTFDWETRLVGSKHIPYSYSIFYFNIFEPEKSLILMKDNADPTRLVKDFVKDCKRITVHHHDTIQSIDVAEEIPVRTNNTCNFCKVEFDEAHKPEYNHSHFVGDNLNLEYNGYICHICNSRAQLRNKPLKFYAHNGSRYDFNMFLPTFLNDKDVKQHEFLNKTESRFTQVVLGFGQKPGDIEYTNERFVNCKYKLSFNDSLLLVQGSLADSCKAWIDKKRDHNLIKTLMGLFYGKTKGLDALVKQSFGKQVFPYSALNDEALIESTKPIPREHFKNTFINRDCDDEAYNNYLAANTTLKEATGFEDYCFRDYHDYYLLLDVILLGVILYNFMNLNHKLNGTNPLAFLSTSSYTFNSFLKHNKDTKERSIIIPTVDVQRFIKRSIRGGFTMIFNKRNLKGKDDYTFYVDFTSLYPTIMSLCQLPREFKEWGNVDGKSVEEIIAEIKNQQQYYHFVECDIAPLAVEHQDKVQNYPMFPETQTIKAEDYSSDQQERWKINGNNARFKDQELNTVSFYAKKNYVCSWSYLEQAMAVGYQVTKIHKVAIFEKDFVMKDYIDKVYQLKKDGKARLPSLKDDPEELAAEKTRITVYKILLNALYGYTIVNSDKHKTAELFDIENDVETIHKRVSSPRFLSMINVGEKVVVNQMKSSYTLEYPLMLGSAILFESKLLTARFMYALYDWFKKINAEEPECDPVEIHPCMMDTDSCVLSIKNFKQIWESYDHFAYDFNNGVYKLFDTCCSEEKYQMPETHDALGYMTNETDGVEIVDFVAVASKCYSYKTIKKVEEEVKEVSTCKGKGVSKDLQGECLNFDLYKSVVNGSIFEPDGSFNRKKYSVTFNDFKSAKFGVNTVPVTKQFVTLVDMKSYYGENSSEYCIFGSEKHRLAKEAENN